MVAAVVPVRLVAAAAEAAEVLVLLVLLAGLLVLLERQVPLQQVQRRQP